MHGRLLNVNLCSPSIPSARRKLASRNTSHSLSNGYEERTQTRKERKWRWQCHNATLSINGDEVERDEHNHNRIKNRAEEPIEETHTVCSFYLDALHVLEGLFCWGGNETRV